MLISPAVLGLVAGLRAHLLIDAPSHRPLLVLPAVLVAWFFGYFAFFAFGLAAKARTRERRATYLPPVYVYGSISLVGIAVALLLQPHLLWWALPFAPLVAVAVGETLRGRARSALSGVSTVLASALLLPALTAVGGGAGAIDSVPAMIWLSMVFLALYFSGTIPFVKTMIRERNNPTYLRISIGYHVLAMLAVLAWALWSGSWMVGGLAVLTMAVALGRAVWIPWSARRGEPWTARRVGMAEVPVLLSACVAVLAAIFF
ncbi:hypothetical protein GCM10027595_00360 [Corynebacterium nasicanis]